MSVELRHRRAGFTLIEVLTALVVIGVIAAIAIPSWRSHLMRTRRADGTAALIAVQRAQDTFFVRHARYATTAQLAVAEPDGLGLRGASDSRFYLLELATRDDGLGFIATARVAPREGQAGDSRCALLSIDHLGQRRAEDADGADRTADCWR
jgi:type IV pilus assembly protein PilE